MDVWYHTPPFLPADDPAGHRFSLAFLAELGAGCQRSQQPLAEGLGGASESEPDGVNEVREREEPAEDPMLQIHEFLDFLGFLEGYLKAIWLLDVREFYPSGTRQDFKHSD